MPLTRPTIVVIGGGIAGLSAAWALARRGADVELLEREPVLGAHSSGRSAAIFRCLHLDPGAAPLALRSAALLDALLGSRNRWLQTSGVLYATAQPRGLRSLVQVACAHQLPHRFLADRRLWARAPALRDGQASHGLLCPEEGVVDVHAVQQALARGIRDEGGRVRTGTAVVGLRCAGGALVGVALAGGEVVAASVAVIAAGAWSDGLGRPIGSAVRLTPLRRHLALLDAQATPEGPTVWRLDDEVYFRPESGGVLVSPCDETPADPGVPATDSEALVALGEKLGRTAPALSRARVRRVWAGLRTFAADRAPVVGADPRQRGLFWMAGLGGQGMSVAVGAGELLACVVDGVPHPLARLLSPSRVGGSLRAVTEPRGPGGTSHGRRGSR